MTIWSDFGFRESPYATQPVPPTDEGVRLFVGRDNELLQLGDLLSSSATHPTVEGPNGVGKTSLVAVAGYLAQKRFQDGSSAQLLIPLPRQFQLTPGISPDEFRRSVYHEIARSFIANRALIADTGRRVPETADVDRWLNSPVLASGGAGVTVAGFGGSRSSGSSANTSTGFAETGFLSQVDEWLKDAFPTLEAGGFVCVIDNLELLETSQAARSLIESLRDSLLNRQGLRWVLCGARGILRTAASSPRLEGVLADPLDLRPVPHTLVPDVIARRLEVFSMSTDAYAPVEPSGFRHVYDVLHLNLRNALKFCEDYSFSLRSKAKLPDSANEKAASLDRWLRDQARLYLRDTTSVRDRAWGVFDALVTAGGSCSPGDFEQFGFNSPMAMRPHIKSLEDANLAQSSVDDTDQRRKTILVTPRGWLVDYARRGFSVRPLTDGD